MKTLKISETLHSQLRINAANQGCSLQSLAEGFITNGIADLLKRKQVWVVYDERDCEIIGVYANEAMAKEVSYRSVWYRREATILNTK